MKKKESGQAMVEFALILPIILLLVCGIIDFGWVFMHEIAVSNAAREGARVGIVYVDDSNFEDKVETAVNNASGMLKISNVSCDARVSGSASVVRDVVVDVSYPVKMLTPVGYLLFGQEYNITGSCTMKAE